MTIQDGHLDKETLREIFIYLYRCWVQQAIGEVPTKLALSPEDGFLQSRTFALYFSTEPVDSAMHRDLSSRVRTPMLVVAPVFPAGTLGIVNFSGAHALDSPFSTVLPFVQKQLNWLHVHKERGLSLHEAYETKEDGNFAIWKDKKVHRLLFQPNGGELHGYAVVTNKPGDYFFRRSKSCKEQGDCSATGTYKRCNHRTESRESLNIDLIYESGETLLLRLAVAGAGYKVFPRQTPKPPAVFP